MKSLLLVFLLTLSSSSLANNLKNEGGANVIKRYIDFIVSEDVYSQYPEAIVNYKLYKMIDYGNALFKRHDLNIVNVVSNIGKSPVSKNLSMDVIEISNNIADKALKAKIQKNTKNGIYTILVVNTDDKYSGCGQANQKIGLAAINFDLVGGCSSNHILSHELGHLDGLSHSGGMGGGVCLDGTLSLMAAGIDGKRLHLFGSPQCNGSKLLHSPFSYYESVKPSRIYDKVPTLKPDELSLATKINTSKSKLKGLTLTLYADSIPNNGRFLIAIPSSSGSLVNETKLIAGYSDNGVVSARLSIQERNNLIESRMRHSLYHVEH